MQVCNESLKLEALLVKADLVINHAGQGMVSAALAMGVPMLLLPMDMETSLTANQAQKLGSAIVLHQPTATQLKFAIAKLLIESRWRKAATLLSKRFSSVQIGNSMHQPQQCELRKTIARA